MQVDREGDLRFQSVVMGITITKLIILEFLDLTDVLTSQEDRCTSALIWNDDTQISTRTSQRGTKNTLDSININACSRISLTRIGNGYANDSARTDFFINCDFNAAETAFAVTVNGYLIICADSIFRTTRDDLNTLNLTERCDIGNDGQSLIETTSRDQFDVCNRTDCSLRCCGVNGIWIALIITADFGIIVFRFK